MNMRKRYKASYRLVRMLAKGVRINNTIDWDADIAAAEVMGMREEVPAPNAVERRARALDAAIILAAAFEAAPA